MYKTRSHILFALAIMTLLVACGGPQPTAPVAQVTDTPPAPSPTPRPPTDTPRPPAMTMPPTMTTPPTDTPRPPEPSPTPTIPPVTIEQNVAYVAGGTLEQKLDIYLPTSGDGPFPTLFMIHGGGGRKEEMAFWGRAFGEKGYAAVSLEHRQWPDYGYPAPVADAFCALAWVHANAGTYGFDPQNVFAMGHSAGGTLVAMLGSVEDPARYLADCPHAPPEGPWVRGTIPFTGIFDYAGAVERAARLNEYASDLLGGTLDEVPETWAEASPATWVDGSELPFLIIHGGSDSNISPGNSEAFAGVLEAAGVEVELLVVPGASHEEITRSEASVQAVEAFVSRLVAEGPPPAGPAFDPSVFMLWSPAFGPEGTIPAKHTCKGEDVSPPLMWGEPPTGTKSLVIVVDDISVGDLTHWLLFNIPPDTRSLPEGVAKVGHLSDGSQQGTNNLFEVGYFGPCPMPGPNRYRFRLFALDTMLDLEDGVMRIPMKQAMRGHILAETELVGVFP